MKKSPRTLVLGLMRLNKRRRWEQDRWGLQTYINDNGRWWMCCWIARTEIQSPWSMNLAGGLLHRYVSRTALGAIRKACKGEKV